MEKKDISLPQRRQRAYAEVNSSSDFMRVAAENGITPRTLLAWINHEMSKWINDPHEGREPGPGVDYDGEFPEPQEELELYAEWGLEPGQFEDTNLRARYAMFLVGRTLRRR